MNGKTCIHDTRITSSGANGGERANSTNEFDVFLALMDELGICAALIAPCFCITGASEDFARLFGHTTESIRRVSFRAICKPNSESRLTDHLDHIFHGKKEHFVEHLFPAPPDRSVNYTQIHGFVMHKDCIDGDRMALVILRRQSGAPGRKKPVVLSETAARIVEGIAMGESSARLASRLNLSRQGVEYHISGLLRKFDAPSRTALISRIFVKGIFAPACWPPKVLVQHVK